MKKKIQLVLSLLISVVLVWFLFGGTDWKAFWESLRGVNIAWLLACQIPIWASFFLRIQRWSYIVRAVRPASFRSMFSATQIGLMVNFVIPLRVGEVIRAVLLTRLAKIPLSQSAAVCALDRVTDIFGLIAVMLVSVVTVNSFPPFALEAGSFGNVERLVISAAWIRGFAVSTGAALVVLIAILVLLYVNQRLAIRLIDTMAGAISKRLAHFLTQIFERFAEGMHILRSGSDMTKSIFFSLLVWSCFVLSGVAVLEAFHMDYPWYLPFVMQSMLAVFVSAPVAPGLVGQFHLPLIISVLWLVDGSTADEAKAFAIVVHLMNIVPVAIAGVYCLAWERFGVGDLARAEHDAEETLKHEPGHV